MIGSQNKPKELASEANLPVPSTPGGTGTEWVTDIDGNIYKSVKVGTKIWTVENLKVTRLNDGTPILNLTDHDSWVSMELPAFCFYDNDPSNKDRHGALYNFFAVDSGKLAPKGWHVPTEEDWETLVNSLRGEEKAGNMLKSESASKVDENGTVAVGFNAHPGGFRSGDLGSFDNFGINNYWWSSTKDGGARSWCCVLISSKGKVHRLSIIQTFGLSVRLVRD